MNLQPYFVDSWKQHFPDDSPEEMPQLICLNAGAYAGIQEQCNAIEQVLKTAKSELEAAAKNFERKKFVVHYLNQSAQRLAAVSQIFASPAKESLPPTLSASHDSATDRSHSSTSFMESESVESSSCFNNTNQLSLLMSTFAENTLNGPQSSGPSALDSMSGTSDSETMNMKNASMGHLVHESKSLPDIMRRKSFSDSEPFQLSTAMHHETDGINCSMSSSQDESSKMSLQSPSSSHGNSLKTANKGNFHCHECSRNFSSKAVLQTHLLRHTGEKPFACDLCDRRFRQRIQLNSHLRTHSDERPYGCVLCGKRFRQQSHIIQHLKVHSGEKPHVCSKCGRDFKQKISLEKHIANQCRGRRRVTTHERIGETLWYGLAKPSDSSPPNSQSMQPQLLDNMESSISSCSSINLAQCMSSQAAMGLLPPLSTSLQLPPLQMSSPSTPLPGLHQAFSNVLQPSCDLKLE